MSLVVVFTHVTCIPFLGPVEKEFIFKLIYERRKHFHLSILQDFQKKKVLCKKYKKNVRRTYIPFPHWLILTMNNKTYSASSSLLNNTLWLDEWVILSSLFSRGVEGIQMLSQLSPKCSQKLFGGHHTCYGVQSDHFNRSICWKKVLDSSKRNISNYRLWSQDFLKRLLSLKKGETMKERSKEMVNMLRKSQFPLQSSAADVVHSKVEAFKRGLRENAGSVIKLIWVKEEVWV